MAYAVVHTYERLRPQERKGSRCYGDGLEGGSHAGAFGVAYACDLGDFDAGLSQSGFDEGNHIGPVVFRCVLGEKSLSRGSVVGGADIGEDLDWFVVWGMVDYTNANLVLGIIS